MAITVGSPTPSSPRPLNATAPLVEPSGLLGVPPAPPAPQGDARRVRSGTDVLEAPGVTLDEILLPDFADNASSKSTSGGAGGRRAEGPDAPHTNDRDYAENGGSKGTSGSAGGGRRADATDAVGAPHSEGQFADNGTTKSTSGNSGGRPRPGASAQAQSAAPPAPAALANAITPENSPLNQIKDTGNA